MLCRCKTLETKQTTSYYICQIYESVVPKMIYLLHHGESFILLAVSIEMFNGNF